MLARPSKIATVAILLFALTACGNSDSGNLTAGREAANEQPSSGLFNGKCKNNQNWLAEMDSAISIPADWQAVYDLTDHSNFENYWGVQGTSVLDDVKWMVSVSMLGRFVVEGNFSKAVNHYEANLYPLMETMDLACGVVTGDSALSTTVLP